MQPVYIRPAENTRKMLDEIDKARHADLWRVLVALSIRQTRYLLRHVLSPIRSVSLGRHRTRQCGRTVTDRRHRSGNRGIGGHVVRIGQGTRRLARHGVGSMEGCWSRCRSRLKSVHYRRRLKAKQWLSPVRWIDFSRDSAKEAIISARWQEPQDPSARKPIGWSLAKTPAAKAAKAEELGVPMLNEDQFKHTAGKRNGVTPARQTGNVIARKLWHAAPPDR